MRVSRNFILISRRKIRHNSFSIKHPIQEISCLTKRLFIQTKRRPSSLISGIVQPLLWLILFGNLFQNIPISLLNTENEYGPFLSYGIVIFTCFTGSLNAGLTLMFDREFGFLNRLLIAPLISKNSIIFATTFFMICITTIQALTIMVCSFSMFDYKLSCDKLCIIIFIILLITSSISNISISLAFILPGHIELLAFILIINLPTLFASTALAPLYFMPYWLQIISKLNPLTYAIESIRFISVASEKYFVSHIMNAFGIKLTLLHILAALSILALLSSAGSKYIASNKLE